MKEMKLFKYKFIFILFIFCAFSPAFAYENNIVITLNTSSERVLPNEKFSLTPSFGASSNSNISTFMIKINFDPSKLVCLNISPTGEISSSEIKTKQEEGEITLIYLSKTNGVDILPGEEFSFFKMNFKAKGEIGYTEISADLNGLGNYNAEPLSYFPISPVEVIISEPTQNDCTLKALEAINARIYPTFSPGIYNYSVDVPSFTDSIEFNAEASDPEASVEINRETLEETGKPTNIVITVTSKDKTEKMYYEIEVNRAKRILVGDQDVDEAQKSLTKNQKSENLNKERSAKKNEPLLSEKLEKIENKSKFSKSSVRKSKNIAPVASGAVEYLDSNFEAETADESTENVADKNPNIIVKEGSFYVPLFCSTAILILVVLFFVYFGTKSNLNNQKKGVDVENNETK
jgi:hypothetical protein